MDRARWMAAAWLCSFVACAAPAPVPEVTPPAKRVLVYAVSAGFVHDVAKRETEDALSIVEAASVDLGRRSGRFEATVSRDAADFSPENLERFDVVFFYTTGELPFDDSQKRALFDFVKQGGAFAGSHCATDTFYGVPEYAEMIGGTFDLHPWHQRVRIRVEDRAHPATLHLGDSFEIEDEIYQFKAPYDRSKVRVLMSLDVTDLDLTKPEVHRTDRDFALAWTKEHGKGRVFYTALGHRPEVWRDARFLKHLEGGLCWAMRIPTSGEQSLATSASEDLLLGDMESGERAGAKAEGDPTLRVFMQSSLRHSD